MTIPPIPAGVAFLLRNATVARTLLALSRDFPGDGELLRLDIAVENGRVTRLAPAGALSGDAAADLDGGMVWPCFADIHTHLDKGHLWPRAPNPDGRADSARATVAADRAANWSAADVETRMRFGLRCAYAQGTKAVRTHLDSLGPQAAISWPVFAAMREEWHGQIELQGVSLLPIAAYRDAAAGAELADIVACSGGILGAVTTTEPDLDLMLDRVFGLAEERGLDLDFHVDETGDRESRSLAHIAAAAIARRFPGRIVVGHCCSLALQSAEDIDRTIDRVAEASIAVTSLPMCNLYLQDRIAGRTPRWRGVTLLHEFAERGVAVMAASDNCRDPFYAYGDHDPVEVFTQAVRIAHLDHPFGDWPRLVTATPAKAMNADARIAEGAPADLVLFRARNYSELLSRAQSDRVVLRGGKPIDRTLPDYRELDELWETQQ
ncbi:MAG TPA: cytosine deaminase [Stellaceae bacterium]|nr:cytosine deaminase [Stellaceae bacterium]